VLAIMSDLHFVDGTAGKHNVPQKAFEMVFDHLVERAKKAKAEEVKILLLGDIVDFLRTERWLEPDVKPEDKPWAIKSPNLNRREEISKKILESIRNENKDTFDLFKNAGPNKFNGRQFEAIYVPGNHDRLLLEFPSLMNLLVDWMGVTFKTEPHTYLSQDYSVFARHGHEYDVWNYEGGLDYSLDDYIKVPIGDPITTDLVTRLPYRAAEIAGGQFPDLKEKLQEVDNVRPLTAVFKWLFEEFRAWPEKVRDVVEEAVDDAIGDFNRLDYVREWNKKHDRPLWPDAADLLQGILLWAEKFKVTRADAAMKLYELYDKFIPDQEPARGARADFARLLQPGSGHEDIGFVVHGHTHTPVQIAVSVKGGEQKPKQERVYLNTGTFRSRHHEALERGFITWKELTYLIFYNGKETETLGWPLAGQPSYETWSGTRKDV